MKKHNFYTMVREDGQNIAKRQEGYTDGIFNYYKKGSLWFAIHPSNGLAICSEYTRKAAAERATAPAMLERIAAALERQQHAADIFAAAVEKAKGAA